MYLVIIMQISSLMGHLLTLAITPFIQFFARADQAVYKNLIHNKNIQQAFRADNKPGKTSNSYMIQIMYKCSSGLWMLLSKRAPFTGYLMN